MKERQFAKAKRIGWLRSIQREGMVPLAVGIALTIFQTVYGNWNAFFYIILILTVFLLLAALLSAAAAMRITGDGIQRLAIKKKDAIAAFQGKPVGGHAYVSFLHIRGENICLAMMQKGTSDAVRPENEKSRFEDIQKEILEKWNVTEKLPKEALLGMAKVELLMLPHEVEEAENFVALSYTNGTIRHHFHFRAVLFEDTMTLLYPDAEGKMQHRSIADYLAVCEMLRELM